MKCPFCGHLQGRVIDSREIGKGFAIRRRRECLSCKRRYTTYERIEKSLYGVIKRDGRREPFQREKIIIGIRKACEKRPISIETIEKIVDEIQESIQNTPEREIESKKIGEMVMERLHELDEVAYVRFASVYRRFKSVAEFMNEIEERFKRREEVRND
jgi:transcriptional repressor NrdR